MKGGGASLDLILKSIGPPMNPNASFNQKACILFLLVPTGVLVIVSCTSRGGGGGGGGIQSGKNKHDVIFCTLIILACKII